MKKSTNNSNNKKVKLPTQLKTPRNKNIVLKKEGDKLDYSKRNKCPVCSKRKMEKYKLEKRFSGLDTYPDFVQISKCTNCKYINSSIIVIQKQKNEYPQSITYFNPTTKPLEKKNA